MYNKIEILVKVINSVSKYSHSKCDIIYSGNYIIISEGEEGSTIFHPYDISTIKSYKITK